MKAQKYLDKVKNNLDELADNCNIGNVRMQYTDALLAIDKLEKALLTEDFVKGEPNANSRIRETRK